MSELICHLVGDYVLQNHWMAGTKTKSWLAALLHAGLYTLPFLVLTQSALALLVIFGTHALIDRYRLARYWVQFWGIGEEGEVVPLVMLMRGFERIHQRDEDGTCYSIYVRPSCDDLEERKGAAPAPPFLAVWLLILVDNTMHLAINHAALTFL